jgi:hypothetical protein
VSAQIPDEALTRFRSRCAPPDPNGCIRWTAGKCVGYGIIWIGGHARRAHRVAYELARGPIPAGLVVDHLCRVRDCVNVEHMELVTLVENIMRGESPPAVLARLTHCLRGHEFTAANTYTHSGRRRQCRACKNERNRAWRAAQAREST